LHDPNLDRGFYFLIAINKKIEMQKIFFFFSFDPREGHPTKRQMKDHPGSSCSSKNISSIGTVAYFFGQYFVVLRSRAILVRMRIRGSVPLNR
jgi:hypothetical protein